jgi:hypothetical protein
MINLLFSCLLVVTFSFYICLPSKTFIAKLKYEIENLKKMVMHLQRVKTHIVSITKVSSKPAYCFVGGHSPKHTNTLNTTPTFA